MAIRNKRPNRNGLVKSAESKLRYENKELKERIEALEKQLSIHVVMCSLNLDEIENLVILKHYDDSDFGWDKKACEEMREESRKAVGYTKADL
jgi:hypothetical protein